MWNSYVLNFGNVFFEQHPSRVRGQNSQRNLWTGKGICVAGFPRSSPVLRFGGFPCVVNFMHTQTHTHR